MINLLEIREPTIMAMLNDPRIQDVLPCLAGPKRQLEAIQPGGKDCQVCARRKKAKREAALGAAIDCIRGARGEKLAKLKQILNARQLRVFRSFGAKQITFTL